MVRAFSKFPKKPAGWVPPSAPLSERKQIFLPEFTVALIRTPFLPPRYASFYVPLSFNKLDMRDYLQRLYSVDVLSVRSYIEQQKVTRMQRGRYAYGKLRRPKSKKRMTVEMVQPFVWPSVPENLEPWEHDQFFKGEDYHRENQDAMRPEAANEPNKTDREAFKEQAQQILDGKKAWKPTWQALGLNYNRPTLGKKGDGASSALFPPSSGST